MKTLIALIFLIIIFSCNNLSDREYNLLNTANESLALSNKNLEFSNTDFFKAIEAKSYDTRNLEKNVKWYEIAKSIKKESDTLTSFLNLLISKINSNKAEELKNFKVVEKVFLKEKNIEVLNKKIINYQKQIFAINEQLSLLLENNSNSYSQGLQLKRKEEKISFLPFFKNQSGLGALTILNNLKNNVSNIENDCFRFCFYNTQPIRHDYHEWATMLVNQSSNKLVIGEELEIIAGIGNFSSASAPIVTIDNKSLKSNYEGVIVYKRKVEKAGEFSMPISIEFTNPDGTKHIQTKIVKYKVVTDE